MQHIATKLYCMGIEFWFWLHMKVDHQDMNTNVQTKVDNSKIQNSPISLYSCISW